MFQLILNPIRRLIIERRRAIFRFWDGRRIRGADPIAVLRSLRADPEYDQEVHLPLVDAGDEEAIRIVANAVRRAFSVAAFESGGLSELELLGVLMDFITFTLALKKNTGPTPNSSEPSPSTSSGDSPGKETTNGLSGCTSTLTESRCDGPPAC